MFPCSSCSEFNVFMVAVLCEAYIIADKCHNVKKGWFSKHDLFNVLNGSSQLLLLHICIFTPTGALVIQYQNT